MIDKNPLLSIVLPTKDRYKYLKHLIKLIDSFETNQIELVLQDNTENNEEIVDFLESNNFSFIRYAHRKKQIPISLNSDLAILKSTGKYVCFIGDDDGVCRNIIDCVKWMEKNDIEAVFSRSAYFSWGNKAKLIKRKKLFIKHDAKKELNRLLKHGLILTKADVPLLYHGIVKRDKLEEVYRIGNTFFGGPTPDISSAVNLSFVIDNYYEVNVPFIINGTSEMTGGGVNKRGGVVNLEDISFISTKDKENWEKEIPPIWTGTYAWANSGIKSLRYMGRDDLIDQIDRDYYLAGAVSTRPKNKFLIKLALNYSHNSLKLILLVLKILFLKYFKKLENLNKRKVAYNHGVNTIIEAEEFFMNNSTNPFKK